ncbi:MAG TPA: hypothetical protein VL053_17645 [Arachidicoccus sp.]|nr:hypothetical protein [Arachidicoccus sp.]
MSITFYNAALVAHVIGITIMAGTTFIDFMAFRFFLKSIRIDHKQAALMEGLLAKLQRFIGIGMLVILASGILMMVKLHEVWGAQLWFRIKMGILLLIIINGLVLRRKFGSKLKKILTEDMSVKPIAEQFNKIRRNLNTVQMIQMLLFVIIFTLSIFKFN